MAKYILYSDLHMRPERQDDCLMALEQIKKAALENNAVVINGGDTFHTRGLIKTGCFDALWKMYNEWRKEGLIQYILVGNHDQEDKEGKIHPMKAFEFDGWKIIDKPEVVDGIAFFPYIHGLNKKIIEETSEQIKRKKKFAVVHWGFKGAYMNDNYKDPSGVPTDWVEKFTGVWSGHYHYQSKIKNIQYIGSPIEQTFAEMGHNKGFWIWDKSRNESEFVSIKGTSKHYEVVYNTDTGKKEYPFGDSIGENDFVRFKLRGEKSKVDAITKLEIQKIVGPCHSIKVQREASDSEVSRLDIKRESISQTSKLIEKYVDYVSTDLDRDKLKKIGLELVNAPV